MIEMGNTPITPVRDISNRKYYGFVIYIMITKSTVD